MTFTLPRPPQDDDELYWTIRALFGVDLPRVSVCAEHQSPFEAVAHAYFSKPPNFAVWYASRGSGKSLALAVLGLTKAFVRDIDVTILGGSMTQSLNVREHMRKLMAFRNAPEYAVAKDQATLIQMSTGKKIIPLPASMTTVRGPHPPLQLLDECFPPETPIALADGRTIPISDLATGQKVASWSGSEYVAQDVLAVKMTGYKSVWRIQINDGRTLETTANHPVLTRGGWVSAKDLGPDHHVLVAPFWRKVVSSQQTSRFSDVYNLTVAGQHTYIAGGVVVHNCDEMEKEIYDASMGQAMEQINTFGEVVDEYIVASSTWQNPAGTFSDIIEDARNKGMPIFSWCHRELMQPNGWMSERFIETKRKTVSAQMWKTEYCVSYDQQIDTPHGPISMGRLDVGEQVLTRRGWKRVTHKWDMGEKETLLVRTDDGRELRLTSDHRVAVPGGWKEAGLLRFGDALITTGREVVRPVLVSSSGAGSILTAASATVPVSSTVDGCLSVPVVSVDADFASAIPVSVTGVQRSADGLQVTRTDAAGVVAQMVDGEIIGDVSMPGHVGDSVSIVKSSNFADSISILGHGTGPLPASVAGYFGSVDDVLLKVGDSRIATSNVFAWDTSSDSGTGHLGTAINTGICHVVSVLPTEARVERVYDITIEDCHEFSADGVILHNCLNEPSSGSRAIDLDKVEAYFQDYPDPVKQTHDGNGDHDEYVWEESLPYGTYAVGADWAKEKDKTIIVVVRYDVTPYKVVKLIRINRRPWPMMIDMFNRTTQDYHANAMHDGTGVGNVVNDYVDYSETTRKFVMVGRERTQMLLDYITAFEHGHYRLPLIPQDVDHLGVPVNPLHRAHRAVTVADVYAPGKWNSHLPDDIAAMALVHRALTTLPQPTVQDSGVTKTDDPREADRQFQVKPEQDTYQTDGIVTVVDERYSSESQYLVGTSADGNDVWTASSL